MTSKCQDNYSLPEKGKKPLIKNIPEQLVARSYAKKWKVIYPVNLIIEHNVSVLYTNTNTLLS